MNLPIRELAGWLVERSRLSDRRKFIFQIRLQIEEYQRRREHRPIREETVRFRSILFWLLDSFSCYTAIKKEERITTMHLICLPSASRIATPSKNMLFGGVNEVSLEDHQSFLFRPWVVRVVWWFKAYSWAWRWTSLQEVFSILFMWKLHGNRSFEG